MIKTCALSSMLLLSFSFEAAAPEIKGGRFKAPDHRMHDNGTSIIVATFYPHTLSYTACSCSRDFKTCSPITDAQKTYLALEVATRNKLAFSLEQRMALMPKSPISPRIQLQAPPNTPR